MKCYPRSALAWYTLLYIRCTDMRANIVTMVICKEIVMAHTRASPNCRMGYLLNSQWQGVRAWCLIDTCGVYPLVAIKQIILNPARSVDSGQIVHFSICNQFNNILIPYFPGLRKIVPWLGSTKLNAPNRSISWFIIFLSIFGGGNTYLSVVPGNLL